MSPIVNISALYEASHEVHPSNSNVSLSLTKGDCHNFEISFNNSCQIEGLTTGLANVIYLDAQFRIPEYNNVIETLENPKGGKTKVSHLQEIYHSMDLIVDDYFLDILSKGAFFDTIKIRPLKPIGPEFDIDWTSWEVETSGDNLSETYQATIKFKIADSDLFVSACCGTGNITEFEDPCEDSEGNPPDPIEDPCADFAVAISYDGTTMDATVTGGPTNGTITYSWLHDSGNGVDIEVAQTQSFNPVDPGTYTVIANKGLCQAVDDYQLMGECTSYSVLLDYVEGVLIAAANRISTFVWLKDTGSGFVVVGGETNPYLVPDESADYKVQATSNGCTDEDTETVSLTSCVWTLSIARNNNDITVTPSGHSGVPVYEWYLDTGSGDVLIAGAVTDTITITEPGQYSAKVTIDGCTKYIDKVVLDECVNFVAHIETVTPDGGGNVTLTAMAIGNPSPVFYTWFQNTGSGWQQIGTGQSIVTSTQGNIRLEAASGTCTSEDELFFCVDPSASEFYQAFFGDNSSTEWEVTNFTLPDPGVKTENQINAELLVFRNGVKMKYSASPSIRTEFSIDYANNEIELHASWPLKTTEILEAIKKP